MLDIGLALVPVAVTAIGAGTIGAWILGPRFVFHHSAVRWSVQAALGFLIVSHLIFLLVSLRLAAAGAFKIVFGLLALVALAGIGSKARNRFSLQAVRPVRTGWPLAVAGFAYCLWILLCAILPPLAVDELIYHLAVPKEILEAGGSVHFLDNIYAYFPQFGEMLFLFGLGVSGEIAARLFHTVFGFLLALALFGFSRRYFSAPVAIWPVILFLSVPSVMVILPWAYVDLMFAFYAFSTLILLLEFFETRRIRWVVLSGIMAGGALATKYTGLQFLLLLVLLLLGEHLFARRKGLPAAALVLVGVALPIVIPYLWRNWQLTGWPLFPFEFGPLALRPEINWEPRRASLFMVWLSRYGGSGVTPTGSVSVSDSLAAPLLVFVKGRFNDPQLYDGIVGPIFFLAPLALWRRKQAAAITTLGLFALLFLLYWGFTIRQVRFLIPVLPLLSFLVIAGVTGIRSRLVYLVIGIFAAASVAVAVKTVLDQKPIAFWFGRESRDEYLGRRLIGYSIYQAANRELGPEDRLYLVNMRNFGYYLEPDWRGDFIFEFYRLERLLSSTDDDLGDFFRSQKITHLLIDEGITYSAFALLPDQQRKLSAFLSRHAALLQRVKGQALYQLNY